MLPLRARILVRCMSPEMALLHMVALGARRPLLELERTSRSHARTSQFDPEQTYWAF